MYEAHARSLSVLQNNTPPPISIRCPSCRQNGTFESSGAGVWDLQVHDMESDPAGRPCRDSALPEPLLQVGAVRRAGFPDRCRGRSYPPEVIDFDTTNIPAAVQEALSEAITCHANECYIAAAIMVRKTLEELCAAQGATGATIKDRIAALRSKVVIAEDLLAGADDLASSATTRRTSSRGSTRKLDAKRSRSASSLRRSC